MKEKSKYVTPWLNYSEFFTEEVLTVSGDGATQWASEWDEGYTGFGGNE